MTLVNDYQSEARAKANAARAVLRAVIEAGESAGYWTHDPQRRETLDPIPDTERDYSQWQVSTHVRNPEGLRFWVAYDFGGSGHKYSAKVCASTCGLDADTLSVHATDARANGENLGTIAAGCDAKRDPAAIAKSLHQRVTSDPDACATQRGIMAELSRRLQSRADLMARYAELRAMCPGAAIPQHQGGPGLPDRVYHSTPVYILGGPAVTLHADGALSIDRSITLRRMADFPALLAMLKD